MRPVRLVIEGLRSYRARQEIAFDPGTLFAITGPTGAGKSSLLDAMFYALYGSCMWDKRAVVDLITDGMDAMTVACEFEVDGRRWEAVRSAFRSGRPGTHLLRAMDGKEKVDGARAVDRRVEELLGLGADDFLKTVVLPQGRFQALLHSSPGDRAPILKGLLGLDELEEVARRAGVQRDQVKGLVDQAGGQREGLPPDPSLAVSEALQGVREAGEARARLQEVRSSCLEVKSLLAESSLGWLQDRLGRLEAFAHPCFDALRPLAAAFSDQEASLRSALDAARSRADELARLLGASRPAGELRRLQADVAWLQENEPRLAQDRLRRDEARRGLEEEQAALTTLRQEFDEARAEAGAAREKVEPARTDADSWAERLDAARTALQQARDARTRVQGVEKQLQTRREALALAVEEHRTLEETWKKADAALGEARIRWDDARRRHVAADLAQHLHVGDPCPVCTRALPKGFRPPEAAGLAEAESRFRAAEEEAARARQAVQRAEGSLDQHRHGVLELEGQLSDLQSGLAATCATLAEALGVEADLDRPDSDLLQSLLSAHKSAERLCHDLAAAAGLAGAKAQGLEDRVAELQGRLAVTEGRLREEEQRLVDLESALATRRTRLSGDLDLADDGRLVEAAGTRLAEDLATVEAWEKERVSQLTRHGSLSADLDKLAERRRRELVQPLHEIGRDLQRLADLLAEGAVPGGVPPAEPEAGEVPGLALGEVPPPDAPLAVIEEAAERLQAARAAALQEVQRRLEEETRRLMGLEADLRARLEAVGSTNLEDLEALWTAAVAAEAVAKRALETAERDAARAQALDTALLPARRLLRSLEFLSHRLGHRPGSFPMWLLERRQRELLEIASRRLGEMTGGHYGFSPSFLIVDRLTMTERPPRTLSGGETFLASLSLALGLAEIVGRKGGRLEAFFLDEGFGNLSPESLDRALDALESLAGTGRLIGVISHVPAVAERIEQVWRVTRTAEGSRVDRLGAVPGPEVAALVAG